MYPSVSQNVSHFTLFVAESNRLHKGALVNIPHRTGILAPNAMQDNDASPHIESSVVYRWLIFLITFVSSIGDSKCE